MQATVEEALAFSATLRLPSTVDKQTRKDFIEEASPCPRSLPRGWSRPYAALRMQRRDLPQRR